jgi:hypothetical protein
MPHCILSTSLSHSFSSRLLSRFHSARSFFSSSHALPTLCLHTRRSLPPLSVLFVLHMDRDTPQPQPPAASVIAHHTFFHTHFNYHARARLACTYHTQYPEPHPPLPHPHIKPTCSPNMFLAPPFRYVYMQTHMLCLCGSGIGTCNAGLDVCFSEPCRCACGGLDVCFSREPCRCACGWVCDGSGGPHPTPPWSTRWPTTQ